MYVAGEFYINLMSKLDLHRAEYLLLGLKNISFLLQNFAGTHFANFFTANSRYA
jgi:hypothetical protein